MFDEEQFIKDVMKIHRQRLRAYFAKWALGLFSLIILIYFGYKLYELHF